LDGGGNFNYDNAPRSLPQSEEHKGEGGNSSSMRPRDAEEQDDSFLTCTICMEAYDETNKRIPRVMDCGHNLCEECLERVHGKCPTCKTISRRDAKNYDLLKAIAYA
jgi:zinc-RING finger domain